MQTQGPKLPSDGDAEEHASGKYLKYEKIGGEFRFKP
jgi:hypothetical protein